MPEGSGGGTWLPDSNHLIHSKFILSGSGEFIRQIFLYDTTTDESVQLFDDDRERNRPIPWAAPELGGETAFLALVLNTQTNGWDLEAYRSDGAGGWEVWATFPPICPEYISAWSAEPFIYEGRSYVALGSYKGIDRARQPGIVWIASVDPTLPPTESVRRLVSNESCDEDNNLRRDPETLVIDNGETARVYLYMIPTR